MYAHLADAGIRWDNTRVIFQSGNLVNTFRLQHSFTGWESTGAGTFSEARTGAAEIRAAGRTGLANPADIDAIIDGNATINRIDNTTTNTNNDLPLAF